MILVTLCWRFGHGRALTTLLRVRLVAVHLLIVAGTYSSLCCSINDSSYRHVYTLYILRQIILLHGDEWCLLYLSYSLPNSGLSLIHPTVCSIRDYVMFQMFNIRDHRTHTNAVISLERPGTANPNADHVIAHSPFVDFISIAGQYNVLQTVARDLALRLPKAPSRARRCAQYNHTRHRTAPG